MTFDVFKQFGALGIGHAFQVRSYLIHVLFDAFINGFIHVRPFLYVPSLRMA